MRFKVLHHRQSATPGQVTVGQTITTVIGVTIEFNAVDCRVGLEKLQNHIQARLGTGVQVDSATRETDPRLTHLIVVHWQQFSGADLVIPVGLAEFHR
ncbi:hypothetical protein D3C77_579690 [compost metagenome]